MITLLQVQLAPRSRASTCLPPPLVKGSAGTCADHTPLTWVPPSPSAGSWPPCSWSPLIARPLCSWPLPGPPAPPHALVTPVPGPAPCPPGRPSLRAPVFFELSRNTRRAATRVKCAAQWFLACPPCLTPITLSESRAFPSPRREAPSVPVNQLSPFSRPRERLIRFPSLCPRLFWTFRIDGVRQTRPSASDFFPRTCV